MIDILVNAIRGPQRGHMSLKFRPGCRKDLFILALEHRRATVLWPDIYETRLHTERLSGVQVPVAAAGLMQTGMEQLFAELDLHLPILEEIYQNLGQQGLEVIGIADESLDVLNSFYQSEHRSPYPLYRDATQALWRRYGIHSVPTLMLLDSEGYIKGVWSGVPNKKALEQIVQETMKDAK